MTFSSKNSFIAFATALLSHSAWAVYPGQLMQDTDPPVRVPGSPGAGVFTDAWKLVGTGACSPFQVSRDFVMSSEHCALTDGAVFWNPLAKTSAGSTVTNCRNPQSDDPLPGEIDIVICRLTNPGNFNAPSAYPPVASPPTFSANDASTQGLLLAFGRGNEGARLNFVKFDGTPVGYKVSTDPISFNAPPIAATTQYSIFRPPWMTSISNSIPEAVMNDSGGAVFWYSPNTFTPALVGVISGDRPLNYTTHFSPALFNWLKNSVQKIIADNPGVSITAPMFIDTATHMGTKKPSVPMLAAPPVITANNGVLTAKWTAPSTPPGMVISGYRFSIVGENLGAPIERYVQGTEASSSGNLPQGGYELCAVPHSGDQFASELFSDIVGWFLRPNCASVLYRAPSTPASLTLGIKPSTTASFRKVGAVWPASVRADGALITYKGFRSVTAPGSSTARTTNFSQSTLSLPELNVLTGSTVCVSVTAVHGAYGLAAQPISRCVVAR